jgi:hypothetical protein
MRRGTETLIRDLAALFVKYRPADWVPLVEELERGSPAQRKIAEAIDELATRSAAARASSKGRSVRPARKKKPQTASLSFSPDVLHLRTMLLDRKVAPGMGSIRNLARAVGLKEELPTGREAAVDRLLVALNDQPEKSSKLREWVSLSRVGNVNHEENYMRWFSLILGEEPKSDNQETPSEIKE